MEKVIILISTLIINLLCAQTNRFIYELEMKMDNQSHKINMALDIDKDFVKFYDYDFIKNDSVSKKTGQNWQTNTQCDQLVIRKINSNDNKTFHDNTPDYFVMESKDEMNWKVDSETKKSGEYSLQKATTNFGGRKWTAWFCSAIPFQEGPYKFRDLPGLIFELQDEKSDFTYKLVKSANLPNTYDTSGFLETHYGNQPIPVTLKQYHKVKLDYYADPVSEMKKVLKEGGNIIINGEKITTQEQLDQKKKVMQENTKKYYNPIELDKAIPYPLK